MNALAGRTVVVTRPALGTLGERLADCGAVVVHVPLITIGPPSDGGVAVDAALAALGELRLARRDVGERCRARRRGGGEHIPTSASPPSARRRRPPSRRAPTGSSTSFRRRRTATRCWPHSRRNRAGCCWRRPTAPAIASPAGCAPPAMTSSPSRRTPRSPCRPTTVSSGCSARPTPWCWPAARRSRRGRTRCRPHRVDFSDVTAAIVTIGRRTAEVAESRGLVVAAVAGSPTDDGRRRSSPARRTARGCVAVR